MSDVPQFTRLGVRVGLSRLVLTGLSAWAVWGLSLTGELAAQPRGAMVIGPNGQPMPAPGGGPGQPGQPPGGPQPGQPGANPGDAPKADGQPAGPQPITRPTQPPTEQQRRELTAKLGEDGKVQLNFHGQKWLDVLEWYADIAGLSLDWQEIPGDYLNLRTQRSYNVQEIRDVLNRHLMDRGYTLLRSGEILIVANLKKLDPAIVPRVMPEDLESLQPHEFAKTSFKLEWLIAETTVEELKPLLSPNGKIWSMKATNRIEALDAASNLLAIRHVLSDEQSGSGQERLVREFKLEHARADVVYDLLLGLLGKEKPKKDSAPMDPQRMMQMQQQMQQMMQQQQQQGGNAGKQKPAEIHLVVNRRENSILANGPPDLIAVVEQAVRQLDVPPDAAFSLLQNPNRMQIYRLASIDPEPIVETLTQVGNLDPETELRIDKKNRAIIAYASMADHVTIKAMVEKLDGIERRFEVIRLRKLEADYVAGTIQFMMGEGEEKQQQSRRNYYFYDPFGGGGSGESEATSQRKFRVDADVEHNRLLIWANDVELEEIQNLLVKLGELPPPGSRASTLRTLDSIPLEDAPYLIERLRDAWPGLGDNPLQLKIHPRAEPPAEPEPIPLEDNTSTRLDPQLFLPAQPAVFRFTKDSVSRTNAPVQPPVPAKPEPASPESVPTDIEAGPAAVVETIVIHPQRDDSAAAAADPATLAQREAPLEADRPRPPGAPVVVELGVDGRWVLRSEDTAALDRLEDLLVDLAPPRRDYKLFQLKHNTSWAFGIAMNLEDFFKEQEDKSSGGRRYFYYDPPAEQKKDPKRLSARRELKFIADTDTNSILVVGADPSQLRIIEELIEYYDQPVASDAKALRRTEIFQIVHSDANVIADAIKDVYRDLLSENDKALQQQNGQNKEQRQERTVTYVYDSLDEGGDKKGSEPPAPVRFKGALSIGVDEVSNSLIISSTESLLANIRMMVQTLDRAAVPKTPRLQVLSIDRNIPVDVVQEKLAKLLKEQKKPRQQPPQPPQNGQPNQPQPQQNQGGPFDP